ncbi:methyl-accepting chemotaxis protein [Cellulomonas sp. P4]|uniref:methyl-accepting chemotaxis protein n=1 Tax=Cellulomonas sp. P4 TaxID=3142533 RepID=UPI0031BA6316
MGTTAPTAPHRRTLVAWFRDRGVSTKILAAVLVAAAVGAAVGVMGIAALGRTDQATTSMYEQSFKGLEYAAVMRRATVEMRFQVANHMLVTDDAAKDAAEQKIDASEAEIRDAAATYGELRLGAEQRASLDEFVTGLDAYAAVRDNDLLPASRDRDLARFVELRDSKAQGLIDSMNASVTALVDHERESAAAAADAASRQYRSNRLQVIVLLAVGTALAVGLGMVVARSIRGGITRVRAVAEGIARRDLTVRAALGSRDELGLMGEALDTAMDDLGQVVATIDASSGALSAAAEEMSATSGEIAAAAEQTSAQAGVVAAAAEQVSRNVQTVAAGSEQMGASIQEIAQNAARAAEVADRAVATVGSTATTMARLGDASRQIGNVVKLITSIAEQTNLLALNATIEAARAGEAGKGFAVVAGEGKELAQETAKATGDIAQQVEAIQSEAGGAEAAIDEISGIIGQISAFQGTIASAVEEQTSTTAEINRSVAEAATGSSEIAANISGVADGASDTTQGVAQSRDAVQSLAAMSADLRTLVGSFRAG